MDQREPDRSEPVCRQPRSRPAALRTDPGELDRRGGPSRSAGTPWVRARNAAGKTGGWLLPDADLFRWCPGEDSNLHGFHRWYLKPVRLPIPPPGHRAQT